MALIDAPFARLCHPVVDGHAEGYLGETVRSPIGGQERRKVGASTLDVCQCERVTRSKEGRDDSVAVTEYQGVVANVRAEQVKNWPGRGVRRLAEETFPGFTVGGVIIVGGWRNSRVDELGDIQGADSIIGEIIKPGEDFAVSEVVDAFPGGGGPEEGFDGLVRAAWGGGFGSRDQAVGEGSAHSDL